MRSQSEGKIGECESYNEVVECRESRSDPIGTVFMNSIHLQTTVLPGSRLEITSPELPVGVPVDVVISVPEHTDAGMGVLDFLDQLPATNRTLDEWAEVNREFRERRDEWAR
jgi:hypothetical protein